MLAEKILNVKFFFCDKDMTATLNLNQITIILAEPQIPENIGSVARAMHNMDIRHLILVAPRNCDLSKVLKMATGTSIDVVQEMEVYDDLKGAPWPIPVCRGNYGTPWNPSSRHDKPASPCTGPYPHISK